MKDKDHKVNQHIRKRLRSLVKELGINKTNLGRALVSFQKESTQQAFLRAQRLINGDSSIKVETLIKVARFFDKPVEYFLPETQDAAGLASSEKTPAKTQKSLDEIRANLKKLGFNKEFIDSQIKQIKAMQRFEEKGT